MKHTINLSKKLLCAILVFSFTFQSIPFVDSIGKVAFGATSAHASTNSALGIQHSELLFYHSDHLGSSSVLSDNNGGVVQRVQYFPYGETLHQISDLQFSQPEADPPLAEISNYKYTNQEEDPETALYYYGARYYAPRPREVCKCG